METKTINIKKYILIVALFFLATVTLFIIIRYNSVKYRQKYSAEYENLIVKRELIDILHMNIIKVERNRFSVLSVNSNDDLQRVYKKLRLGLADVRQVYFLLKNGGVYQSNGETLDYEKVDDIREELIFDDIELTYLHFFQYLDLIFQPGRTDSEFPIVKDQGTFKIDDDKLYVLKELDDQIFKLYGYIDLLNQHANKQIKQKSEETASKLATVAMLEMTSYVLIIVIFFILIVSLFIKLKKYSKQRAEALKSVKDYSNYISNLFDSLPIGVLIVDKRNEIKQFNTQLKSYFLTTPDDELQETIRRVFLAPLTKLEKPNELAEIVVYVEGSEKSFLCQSTEFDLNSEELRVLAFVDINRRKQIEKQIKIQNSIFHDINLVSDEYMKSKEISGNPIEQLFLKTGILLKAKSVSLFTVDFVNNKPQMNLDIQWRSNESLTELYPNKFKGLDWLQSGLQRWLQLFENGLELFSFYADLPDDEKNCLREMPFYYIYAFPVFVNGSLYGFITYAADSELSAVLNLDKTLISALRMTFEAFLERIRHDRIVEQKNSELMAYSEELEAQSDALKEQNIEMAFQRQKIEEANKLKSEFITNMSHELRTPMNAIIGISKMLLKYNAENLTTKQLDGLKLIGDSGKRLLTQINDILDLSKVDSGKMELKESWVLVEKIIATVIQTYTPLANEKNIKLVFIRDERFVEKIYIDEMKLLSILTNLVGNAIKFTEQGSVTISSYIENNRVYFEVADTGIGIQDEFFDVIFDEFKQVDGSHSKKYPGTGLGLALSKKLVELIGGEISVESELSIGSKFTFYVPFDYENAGIVNNLIVKEVKSAERPAAKAQSKVHMLIVEDDYNNLYLYSEYVSSLNYEIKYAKNGKEAMHFIEDLWPDVIVLDLNIPKVSGFDILKYLEQIKNTKQIPVIVISATENSAIEELHYFEYIKKPVSEEIFLKTVHSAVMHLSMPKPSRNGMSKVLVVDDEKIGRTTIQLMLEGQFQLEFATNGKEAVEVAIKNPPDIILMDIMMPVMDGFDAYTKIRSLFGESIPIIALTAKAMKSERNEILKRGFDAYLPKPVDDELLITKINDAVQNKTKKPA